MATPASRCRAPRRACAARATGGGGGPPRPPRPGRRGGGGRAGRPRELTVAYLSSARGEVTLVEARMLRKGGHLAVGGVEVRDAASGALNATLRVACEVEPAERPRAASQHG